MSAHEGPQLPAMTIARIGEFVSSHLAEGIGVSDVANEIGYSRSHFTRAFTASTGASPGVYLTARRIDLAKRLLLSDRSAVIDIAAAVGFDSLSSFTRRFTGTVGTTPGGLRTTAKRLEDGSPRPFAVTVGHHASVTVNADLPEDVTDDCRLWLGWYPTPLPVGLPVAGILSEFNNPLELPLCSRAPWLLGFVVQRSDHYLHELIPQLPVVGSHPMPITRSCAITLHFRRASSHDIPLLSALPVLDH